MSLFHFYPPPGYYPLRCSFQLLQYPGGSNQGFSCKIAYNFSRRRRRLERTTAVVHYEVAGSSSCRIDDSAQPWCSVADGHGPLTGIICRLRQHWPTITPFLLTGRCSLGAAPSYIMCVVSVVCAFIDCLRIACVMHLVYSVPLQAFITSYSVPNNHSQPIFAIPSWSSTYLVTPFGKESF